MHKTPLRGQKSGKFASRVHFSSDTKPFSARTGARREESFYQQDENNDGDGKTPVKRRNRQKRILNRAFLKFARMQQESRRKTLNMQEKSSIKRARVISVAHTQQNVRVCFSNKNFIF
jgi:hypothetical protein